MHQKRFKENIGRYIQNSKKRGTFLDSIVYVIFQVSMCHELLYLFNISYLLLSRLVQKNFNSI